MKHSLFGIARYSATTAAELTESPGESGTTTTAATAVACCDAETGEVILVVQELEHSVFKRNEPPFFGTPLFWARNRSFGLLERSFLDPFDIDDGKMEREVFEVDDTAQTSTTLPRRTRSTLTTLKTPISAPSRATITLEPRLVP